MWVGRSTDLNKLRREWLGRHVKMSATEKNRNLLLKVPLVGAVEFYAVGYRPPVRMLFYMFL